MPNFMAVKSFGLWDAGLNYYNSMSISVCILLCPWNSRESSSCADWLTVLQGGAGGHQSRAAGENAALEEDWEDLWLQHHQQPWHSQPQLVSARRIISFTRRSVLFFSRLFTHLLPYFHIQNFITLRDKDLFTTLWFRISQITFTDISQY